MRYTNHIGIDQSKKNYAIIVIVSAKLNNLKQLKIQHINVVMALRNTAIFLNVQLPGGKELAHAADKICAHVQQMSMHNPSAKTFSIELAKAYKQCINELYLKLIQQVFQNY